MGVTTGIVTGSTSVAQNQNVQKNADLVKKDNAIKNGNPFETNTVAKNENLSGMDAFQKTCVDKLQEKEKPKTDEKPKSKWQKLKEAAKRTLYGMPSLLVPGFGQFCNNQIGKGILISTGYLAAAAGMVAFPPLGIVASGLAVYSAYDAGQNMPQKALA